MDELILSIGEPFTSPAFNSNFVAFSNEAGRIIPQDETEEYVRKVCRYAKHYGVYLVPERFIMMGYQCLCLVSPEGRVIGAQKNLFLNTANKAAPKRSTAIEVWPSPFGGIFLCVDVDIYHPEVARVACNMGARIIVSVQRISPGDYAGNMVVTGPWNAAQQNNVYVVSVCDQFHSVSAPLPLTPHGDGFIVPPNLKLPMTARIQTDRLQTLPRRALLNRQVYVRHREDLSR